MSLFKELPVLNIMKKLRDKYMLLKRVLPGKTMNAARVLSSYYISRWTGQARQWGLPFSLSVEPTTSCNLRCPECPSGLRSFTRPTGHLEPRLFQKIVDELSRHLLYLNFYFQGEPFIHKELEDMIAYAASKGIYTSSSTNAHFLSEERAEKIVKSGLHRLIISIDGSTQEVYEQYRREGQLDKVIEGTRNLISARRKLRSSTPYVIFQFLIVRPNEHQSDEIRLLAKELGVDEVKFKTAQIYDFENGHPLIPLNSKYSRYARQDDGSYKIKNPLHNQCWKLWHSAVITWDGRVLPCCFDKDASYEMGNIKDRAFADIWYGEAYRDFRRRLLLGRKEIDICRNCSEGTKVWT